MLTARCLVSAIAGCFLLIAGCATSPEAEIRREGIEADIAGILEQPLDSAEFGETLRCLSEAKIRSFRALDDRRLVFEGRGDKLWLNTLRGRCPDLRHGDTLRVRSISWSRICDADTFQVGDWFDWPWYRRWPWHWSPRWGMNYTCSLGKFQPVTDTQVGEIEAVLRSR